MAKRKIGPQFKDTTTTTKLYNLKKQKQVQRANPARSDAARERGATPKTSAIAKRIMTKEVKKAADRLESSIRTGSTKISKATPNKPSKPKSQGPALRRAINEGKAATKRIAATNKRTTKAALRIAERIGNSPAVDYVQTQAKLKAFGQAAKKKK